MATYNCQDSSNSAYGAASYGTCTGQTVGAPDTGIFGQFVDGGAFTILLPFAAAIIVTVVSIIVMKIRKKPTAPAE